MYNIVKKLLIILVIIIIGFNIENWLNFVSVRVVNDVFLVVFKIFLRIVLFLFDKKGILFILIVVLE